MNKVREQGRFLQNRWFNIWRRNHLLTFEGNYCLLYEFPTFPKLGTHILKRKLTDLPVAAYYLYVPRPTLTSIAPASRVVLL